MLQVNHKIRSFLAPQLASLIEGLSRLGYKPRSEICNGLLGQTRRHLHVFTPSQLPVVLHALASYDTWVPYRQFLYDYVTRSTNKIGNMSGEGAVCILWSFARFKYVPQEEYVAKLLLQVRDRLLTTCCMYSNTEEHLPAANNGRVLESCSGCIAGWKVVRPTTAAYACRLMRLLLKYLYKQLIREHWLPDLGHATLHVHNGSQPTIDIQVI